MSSSWLLDSRAPDLCFPVVGFRQWRLAGGWLASPYTGTAWQGAELLASCDIGRHDPAETPSKLCTCGIYALYDPCPRTASAATPDLVSGVVVVWGRIETHATALRASHARVVGLELPMSRWRKRRRIAELAERLGVPLVAHAELRATAAAHGLPLPASLRPARAVPTRARARGPRWHRGRLAIRPG